MAKRRRLDTPSQDDLKAIEAELGGRGAAMPKAMAPIAQVAAEAAALAHPEGVEARAEAARTQAMAAQWAEAEGRGLVIREVPLDRITGEALTRDRVALDPEAMAELVASIRAHGLRMPIELAPETAEGQGYGLVSGFRRLSAYRQLRSETGDAKWDVIPALIRDPGAQAQAYVAMVEENEIRAELSPYERGRIAVIAAGEGAFPSVGEAVDRLFATASKAKRSKIRSYALVHESLGDLLAHATGLTERQILRIGNAIRAGFGDDLRDALDFVPAENGPEEWDRIVDILDQAEDTRDRRRQPGRPKAGSRAAAPRPRREGEIELLNGMSVTMESGPSGYAIRFHGQMVDRELVRTVMLEIQRLLG